LKKFICILFFAAVIIKGAPFYAATSENPATKKAAYRYDFKRSGYVRSAIAPPFRMKWFVNTSKKDDYKYAPKVNYSLIADGDTLFFGTLEKSFCAFDTVTKEYKWCFTTIGDVHAGATLFDDRIYVGDAKGYIYCLDKVTGELKWQRAFSNEILSSPLIEGEELYFTDMNDTLYCISTKDGSLLWKADNSNFSRDIIMRGIASPSFSGGLLYQGFSDGYLYCYDIETKDEVFRKKVKDSGIFHDVDSPAAIDGDTVYASSFDGSFIAMHLNEAKSKWELKLKGNGYPAFNDNDLIISSGDGTLYKVDKEYGGIIWEKELSINLTPPVITDDYVFVASEDYFYVVDIGDGEVKYEYEPGSGISSELCIIGDNLYFISNKGYLYCFKPESGAD
jgi:outer membrane protein assembly factor BamB